MYQCYNTKLSRCSIVYFKECFKTESLSCSMNISRRVEDVRQNVERAVLIPKIGRRRELNLLFFRNISPSLYLYILQCLVKWFKEKIICCSRIGNKLPVF
jgi:hypothetical protein